MKAAICRRCIEPTSSKDERPRGTCKCGRVCCVHLIGKDGKCGPCRIGEYNARRKAAKAAGGAT